MVLLLNGVCNGWYNNALRILQRQQSSALNDFFLNKTEAEVDKIG